MIIDFRVTVPLKEYLDRIPSLSSVQAASKRPDGGYARVYREKLVDDYKFTTKSLLKSMDDGNIDKAVLQAEFNGIGDYQKINAAACNLVKVYPDRFLMAFM